MNDEREFAMKRLLNVGGYLSETGRLPKAKIQRVWLVSKILVHVGEQ
jgi:hypothetical protein